jgi:hypothetical protein
VQPGFGVIVLPRQAQVVGEAAEPLGVGVGGVGAEGVGEVPAPAQLLSRAEDLARGVERGKDGLAPRNPPFEIHRRFPEGGLREYANPPCGP